MSGLVKHRNVTPLIEFIRDIGRGVSKNICIDYVILFDLLNFN